MTPGGEDARAALQQILMGVRHNRAPCSRWVLEPEDVILLERVFALEKCPGRELRQQLSEHLNVTSRQVQVWFQNKRQRTKNGAKPTAAEVLARSQQNAALQTGGGGSGSTIQDAGEVLLSLGGRGKDGDSPTHSVTLGKRSSAAQRRGEQQAAAQQQMPLAAYGMMGAFPGMTPWGAPVAHAPMFFQAPMGRMMPMPMGGMMPYPHGCAPAAVSQAGSETSSEAHAAPGEEPTQSPRKAQRSADVEAADAQPLGLNLPDAYTDGQRVWLRQDLIMSTTQLMQAPGAGAAGTAQPAQCMQMAMQQLPQPSLAQPGASMAPMLVPQPGALASSAMPAYPPNAAAEAGAAKCGGWVAPTASEPATNDVPEPAVDHTTAHVAPEPDADKPSTDGAAVAPEVLPSAVAMTPPLVTPSDSPLQSHEPVVQAA